MCVSILNRIFIWTKILHTEVAKIAKRANPITLLFFVILLFLLPQLDKKELTTSAIRSDPDTPVTSPPGGTS